ncbi:MAG: serine protease [Schlesneria sp.]
MTVRITQMLILIFLILVTRETLADDPVEELLQATFRIADREHSGTCFLISPKDVDAANPRRLILATAAHVMEQMAGNVCELILREETEDHLYLRRPMTITVRNDGKPLWTRHPDIDIATIFIDLPENVAAKPIPIEQLANEAQVVDKTVRVGRETWIPCYPAKLEANEAGWPVLRKGSIASHPLTPVKSTKTMLIDYRAFGGDSGSPVAMVVNDQLLVVGVVLGMHRQTDRSSLPFEERTMHTPLGLSIVGQAAFLHETIDLMINK